MAFLRGNLSVSNNVVEHNREWFVWTGSCRQFPRAMSLLSCFIFADCLFTDGLHCSVGCIYFLCMCLNMSNIQGFFCPLQMGTMCLSCCRTKVQPPACHVLLDITVLVSTPAGRWCCVPWFAQQVSCAQKDRQSLQMPVNMPAQEDITVPREVL